MVPWIAINYSFRISLIIPSYIARSLDLRRCPSPQCTSVVGVCAHMRPILIVHELSLFDMICPLLALSWNNIRLVDVPPILVIDVLDSLSPDPIHLVVSGPWQMHLAHLFFRCPVAYKDTLRGSSLLFGCVCNRSLFPPLFIGRCTLESFTLLFTSLLRPPPSGHCDHNASLS